MVDQCICRAIGKSNQRNSRAYGRGHRLRWWWKYPRRGEPLARLVARSTPTPPVVGSSPTRGTEHFGFPPSAPRPGNERPGISSRVCGTRHIKYPVPLMGKRGLSPGGRFPRGFIIPSPGLEIVWFRLPYYYFFCRSCSI